MNNNPIYSYVFCFIDSFLIYFLFHNVFTPKHGKKISTILLFTSVIVLSVIVYFLSNLNLLIRIGLLIILIPLLSLFLYKDKIYITLFFSMLGIYVFLIIDIIISLIFAMLAEETIQVILATGSLYSILLHIFAKLVNLIIFLLIARMFKALNFNISTKYWILLNIIMVVNLFIALVFMEQSSGIFSLDNGLIHYLIFASGFLVMSCFVVYFFIQICLFFQKEKEYYITDTTNKALCQQIEIQNVMIENIKKIKHDMKNNLLNISMLINQNKTNEVLEYINELTAYIQQHKSNICRTENSIVDAIVNCKITFCESNNIKLNLKADKLPELYASFSEMTTILSNILDNSIEASLKLDESNRKIDVSIFVYKNYAVFTVKNKFNNVLNIKNGVIKTTKLNKSLHGYGLSLIEDTVKKNNGVFNYSHDDDFFKVTVMLPLKIQKNIKTVANY